jgi:alkanesulfonate monooxygenase SsuD/methylene tetrahydromethanopterin reductase-like flavin-dependent oxidoreductase (luciferase family)
LNIGLSFDLRNPPGWRQDPSRLHGFTLEVCEEAERLGAHSVWVSEHHLFEDGYLTQPLTFAAAIAARTSRIRIGTGILVAPLHSAVQIAEQAALVDIVSNGRVILGMGAGYRVPEFDLYGAQIGRRFSATADRVRQIRAIWSEGRVTPLPVQSRVPIYLGYQAPKGAHQAGLLGEGLLSIRPELSEPYEAGLTEGGHSSTIAARAGTMQCWVTEDPERDWALVSKHLGYHMDSYRRYSVEGTGQPVPNPIDLGRVLQGDPNSIWSSFAFGTPDEVAERIVSYLGGLKVDTLYFSPSIAGMPEDVVGRAVVDICTKLAPALQFRLSSSEDFSHADL